MRMININYREFWKYWKWLKNNTILQGNAKLKPLVYKKAYFFYNELLKEISFFYDFKFKKAGERRIFETLQG